MKWLIVAVMATLIGCGLSPQDMRAKIDECTSNGFGYNIITNMGVKGGGADTGELYCIGR